MKVTSSWRTCRIMTVIFAGRVLSSFFLSAQPEQYKNIWTRIHLLLVIGQSSAELLSAGAFHRPSAHTSCSWTKISSFVKIWTPFSMKGRKGNWYLFINYPQQGGAIKGHYNIYREQIQIIGAVLRHRISCLGSTVEYAQCLSMCPLRKANKLACQMLPSG